ncbi:hypothetical protein V8F20_006182 [Naviculisporaceae sp. PSN 640]
MNRKNQKTMEFTVFPRLPAELRLMIWEFVPQPRRLVGPVFRHQDGSIRFVALPRDRRANNQTTVDAVAIFPPLHACRESRAVWLRRYERIPSRYLTGKLRYQDDDFPSTVLNYSIRFDVPFVSYEADIFTVFRLLDYATLYVPIHQELLSWEDDSPDVREFVEPFMGLDRNRIRQVAIGEDHEAVGRTVAAALYLPSLPCLEKLWVLSFAPQLESKEGITSRWRPETLRPYNSGIEMTPEEAVDLECTGILDVPELAVVKHGLFGAERPRHQIFSPRPHVRPLKCYRDMLKAWLWHSEHSGLSEVHLEQIWVQLADTFEDSVLGDPPGVDGDMPGPDPSSTCPLRGVAGCGPSEHTIGDILTWVPRFEIRHLMLYDKASWVQDSIFADYS